MNDKQVFSNKAWLDPSYAMQYSGPVQPRVGIKKAPPVPETVDITN